jgi:hypothetical protein
MDTIKNIYYVYTFLYKLTTIYDRYQHSPGSKVYFKVYLHLQLI